MKQYFIHYILQSTEDQFKHIHGALVKRLDFTIDNHDIWQLEGELSTDLYTCTVVGWQELENYE